MKIKKSIDQITEENIVLINRKEMTFDSLVQFLRARCVDIDNMRNEGCNCIFCLIDLKDSNYDNTYFLSVEDYLYNEPTYVLYERNSKHEIKFRVSELENQTYEGIAEQYVQFINSLRNENIIFI